MDNQICKYCPTPLYGKNRCPSCGRLQNTNTILIVVGIGIALIALFGGIVFGSLASQAPITQAVTTTASAIATATTNSTLTPTTEPIIATPSAADGWTKIHPGLYAKRADNRSECFEMGDGLEYCAGEPVEYYATLSGWVAYYETPGSMIWETIAVGEVSYVYVPSDATEIHWVLE